MCEHPLSINKKMKDIETGISNIISADNRTLEQNTIVAKATSGVVGKYTFIDRYKFLSELFNSYEEVVLKKYNIKK